MTTGELVALVDRLRALPSETEWFEFKRSRHEPQAIGEYLSALANAACLANQPRGYLVFGIDDDTHAVIGTPFDPYATKAKGNQDLLPWLASGLRPNPGVEAHALAHPDGRVVLFEVGPARGEPVAFYGTPYIRVGSSKTELRNHPEKARTLWTRGSDWSAELCEAASIDDLDPAAVAKAREQFVVKHPAQAAEVADWDDTTFLNKARVLKQGAVTKAALLLLGRPESATLLSPAVAKISWILKDAENRELDYEHIGTPFLLAGDRLLKRIRNLIIDTQGGGIKRMFETQRRRSFPLPDYDLSDPGQVSVSVTGRILDERYTRLLMERTDLDLAQVVLLDRVQKGQRIGRDEHRRLKSAGLVEGRYPNIIMAAAVAKAAGEAGRHIRERGFDKQYYLDLILALVHEHAPVSRREIDEAVIPKLSDRLREEQKRRKVHNLLQELRRAGKIDNRGSRGRPAWYPIEGSADE